MSLKAKSRSRYTRIKGGKIETAPRTGKIQTGPWVTSREGFETLLPGTQYTESEGHQRARNGAYYEGGPFYTYLNKFTIGSVDYSQIIERTGGFQRLSGPIFCPWPQIPVGFGPTRSSYSQEDWGNLDEDGTTAISLVAPTNPTSKLAILLGEAKKDGIPSLPGIHTWKERTAYAKSAGHEYLNVQFGWRPLVEEVLQVGSSARHSRDIVKQYQRDEGKNVRREFRFPDERTITSSVSSTNGVVCNISSTLENNFRDSAGAKLTKVTETLSRKWFSGAFTYALPSRTDSLQRMLGYGTEADRLFGITLTPDVLWELAPWSWAIDWFSNTGNVIHNVTNFGLAGLVMRYGYMCRETQHKITQSLDRSGLVGSSVPPSPSFVEISTKARRPANPFGFGLSALELSPTKIAIAAALGLTHLL